MTDREQDIRRVHIHSGINRLFAGIGFPLAEAEKSTIAKLVSQLVSDTYGPPTAEVPDPTAGPINLDAMTPDQLKQIIARLSAKQ